MAPKKRTTKKTAPKPAAPAPRGQLSALVRLVQLGEARSKGGA